MPGKMLKKRIPLRIEYRTPLHFGVVSFSSLRAGFWGCFMNEMSCVLLPLYVTFLQ